MKDEIHKEIKEEDGMRMGEGGDTQEKPGLCMVEAEMHQSNINAVVPTYERCSVSATATATATAAPRIALSGAGSRRIAEPEVW